MKTEQERMRIEVEVKDLIRKCPICKRNKVELSSLLKINISKGNDTLVMLVRIITGERKVVDVYFDEDINKEIEKLVMIWNDTRLLIPCCSCNALSELFTDPSCKYDIKYTPETSHFKTKPYEVDIDKDGKSRLEYISKTQYNNFRKFGIINE